MHRLRGHSRPFFAANQGRHLARKGIRPAGLPVSVLSLQTAIAAARRKESGGSLPAAGHAGAVYNKKHPFSLRKTGAFAWAQWL